MLSRPELVQTRVNHFAGKYRRPILENHICYNNNNNNNKNNDNDNNNKVFFDTRNAADFL